MAASAGGISWLFSLIDKATGPAKQITGAVDAMTKSVKDAEGAAAQTGSRFSQAFAKIQSAAKQVGTGIKGAIGGIGQSFRSIVNLPNAVAGGFAAWGGKLVLDAVGWRESTLSGLNLLLGGQEKAAAVMAEIETLSTKLKLPMDIVARHMEDFLRTGRATVGESEVMLRALGEVYAVKGFKPEVFEQAAETMRFMLSQASLSSRAVVGLRQSGISIDIFMKHLAAIRKETPEQVKKALAAGTIAGKQGAQAMVAAIQEQFSRGQPIGTAMAEASRTLPGLMTGLRTAWGNLWKKLDIGAMPGLEPFRKLVESITKIFEDPKLVKAVEKVISEIFAVIFGKPAKEITPESILGFMQKLPGMAERAVKEIKGFGKGVEEAFGVIKGAWKLVEPAFTMLMKLFTGGAEGAGGEGGAGKAVGFGLGILIPLKLLSPIITPLVPLLKSLTVTLFGMGKAWIVGMGPLGWIALALAAIAAGFIWAYNNIKPFRDAIDGIGAAIGNAWKAFEKWGTELDAWVMGLAQDFKNWLGNLWESFDKWGADAGDAIVQWGVKIIAGADEWLANLDKTFTTWLGNIWKELTDWGGKMWEAAVKWGTDLIGGFVKGITDKFDAVKNTLTGIWNAVTGNAQAALKEGSPSKVFERIGANVMAGFERGLGDRAPDVPMPAVAGANGNGGAGRMRATLSLVINISGAESPRETGDAVRQSVTSALGQWFDLFAQETGGVPTPAGPG